MNEVATILCVDDEPATLMAERALLESAGFCVVTASSGPQAIAIFRSQDIDIVVMDYWMPGMNGITAALNIKRLDPNVPIVFLSAYSELPGEAVGIAECWLNKNEEEAEHLLARLRLLAPRPGSIRRAQAS